MSGALLVAPAQADPPVCTTTIAPGGPSIQATLNAALPGDVVCLSSGTYSSGAPLRLPVPVTLAGVGSPLPVILCTGAVYCIDASVGPSDVTLQDLVVQGAKKMDLQIGSTNNTTLVTGWTLSGITVKGAGNVGIAMNNASDITLTDSTITQNGSKPYAGADHTGDFGIRAVHVTSLTVADSTFADNVTTNGANDGFSGGAKFNNDSNFSVTGNSFTGNTGGGQLWMDIDSHDFNVANNTISGAPNVVTGALANEGIRVEVSCGGTGGATVANNVVSGGTTAGIDVFDSNGIQVQQNQVSITLKERYGIRMYANTHAPQASHDCEQGGAYPNASNTATDNTVADLTTLASGLNGVVNDPGGISSGNVWSANIYMRPHCTDANWVWWDGSAQQQLGFSGWQGQGQDPDGTCVSTVPELDSFAPTEGPAATVVTIQGSGLSGASSVTFNGIAATTFSVDSDTQITATVPDGTVTGPICVQAAQTLCTASYFVDNTVGGTAAALALLPSSGSAGTSVAIQGFGFTGALGVTFANGASAAFTVVSDTEIDTTAPPGVQTGPVCVEVADTNSVCAPTFTLAGPPGPTHITSPNTTFRLAPYALSWNAVSAADSYLAQWRSAPFNKGYAANWTSTTTTGTTLPFPATPGQTTCFKVTTKNSAGSTPSAQTCTAVPLDDRGLTVVGAWTKSAASRYYQGTAITGQKKNVSLTLKGVKAEAIALVVELQPGGGSVNVLLGGKLIGSVSTAGSPVQDQQLVNVASWPTLHTGTITIKVTTTGKPVVIDGIGIYRG